ncbi:hypothetical protein ACFX1Q_046999 [Malus domestica]
MLTSSSWDSWCSDKKSAIACPFIALWGTYWKLNSYSARIRRSTILSALDPDHAFMVLFLGTLMRTSQWVTHPGNALARTRLTSEFQWNPKPVSS